jgi:ABC-2 type transport system ATP-binding protein
MIQARGLTRNFGSTVAVEQLDLDVPAACVTALLGANGAGKTTTMRLLAGFLNPSSGWARIDGLDVFEQPAAVQRRVGYLPETPPLYPELRVGEYVSYVAQLRGVDHPRKSASRALDRVGLLARERSLVGSLSRGMRQRAALAGALVHEPAVLLLDEPTAGLDPVQARSVRMLLAELAEESTVLLSTHMLSEVQQLCSSVLLLHRGRLVGHGTPEEVAALHGYGASVEVVLRGCGPEASGVISALEEVDALTILGPGHFEVRGVDSAAAVTAAAVAAGWSVEMVRPKQGALEAVFLDLAGRP